MNITYFGKYLFINSSVFFNDYFLSFQRSEETNGAMGDIGVSQAELVGGSADTGRKFPQYIAALSGEL